MMTAAHAEQQHALTSQLDQIAGRDDRRQPRHQKRNPGPARDAIKIEQAEIRLPASAGAMATK